ncbi:hypothetical protein ZIOFF_046574 [Zingiber officinale]|uniref:adenylate kinase n=2 Tax=Zingiber officinale TaxID=94328 RepID=A0A8J5FPJ0_ZINOF|nr:hypothetical protein ZIOFF_046574 [Zingiber officinale]
MTQSTIISASMAGISRLGDAAGSLARRIFPTPSHRRSFAAAALAEMDYWTEWEEEEELGRHASMVAAETCRERRTRGLQWVFMGIPGVQRSGYATRVAKLLDVPYISMGSLVRQELHPNSSLYKMIVNAMNDGKLVPEEIIFGILSKRLEDGYQRGDSGFILDGIPRTRTQAEILDQIADIDLVVNLKCVQDCFVKKHFGADICSHCGKTSDAIKLESTRKNPCLDTCTCHVQLNSSSAVDMKNHRIEKSLVYTQQIHLLEDYYRKQKKLLDVQVIGSPGQTWQGLLAALNLQHMDTASPSQKLTV